MLLKIPESLRMSKNLEGILRDSRPLVREPIGISKESSRIPENPTIRQWIFTGIFRNLSVQDSQRVPLHD